MFENNQKISDVIALSDYDVISNFGSLILPPVPSKMRLFRNFLFLNQLSSNLVQGLRIGC